MENVPNDRLNIAIAPFHAIELAMANHVVVAMIV